MSPSDPSALPYRGRLAPSPTGFLHLGHARTFWIAQQRARSRSGTLILRNEDLDSARSKPEFAAAMLDDLRWFGIDWQEGPDRGGPFAPYSQSERRPLYLAAFEKLLAANLIYPCTCSRKDVQSASRAPHAGDDEALYPGTCRSKTSLDFTDRSPATINWRFRVSDGETISFIDAHFGPQQFVAGKDFGDFIIWQRDEIPAYQLAVVVDDDAMQITEVVRGADLLKSTARQLLLYRAFALAPPGFYHCDLMTDEQGQRLAKRHNALSLRTLRAQGITPATLRQNWGMI